MVPARAAAPDAALFSVMQKEMGRSLERLKTGSFGPPYFIAYRLVTRRVLSLTASFGGIERRESRQWSTLYVEVRYGSRRFDNTDMSFQGWQGAGSLDPEVLREKLWWLTDKAYKEAVSGYLRKKADRATEFLEDEPDDFSVEAPTQAVSGEGSFVPDEPRARRLIAALSALLKAYPYVYSGTATLSLGLGRRYLVTSEGTRLATPAERLPDLLSVHAFTRAKDGMGLDDFRSWVFDGMGGLPPLKALKAAVRDMARELGRERRAPLQAPAAAPAVLDPEFSGVLFHEALGHKLEGQRQRDPRQGQIFKNLVGKRIIPPFLSVFDDPTLPSFGGEPLHGAYSFDSEGVPARAVTLVDHGVLRHFLMSRWPIKGFPFSNGHGRSDDHRRPTGRMAVLIVRADRPKPVKFLFKELRRRIKEEGKPYGFYLDGSFGGDNPTERSQAQTLQVKPRLLYRIYPDGRRELVRGASMVGTPLAVLNEIVAAGTDEALSNAYFCGAESGFIPVSQIAPSLLLSTIELQRLPERRESLPVLPSPFKGRQ